MELTGYYIKIAKLIAREITDELSKSEREELYKWLSTSKENNRLYKKIRSEITGDAEDNINASIQTDIAWKKIVQKTALRKKSSYFANFLKSAAIFLIIISASAVIYYSLTKTPEPEIAVNSSNNTELQPGYQRALLVTSDGSSVDLEKGKTDTIREEDGSYIQNSNSILTYNNTKALPAEKKHHEKTIFNTLITPKGGEYNLVLADGTKIWLNADSKLKYPVKFSGIKRVVELEGEAYFEVAKNVNKPFLIKTNDYNVEVLGTVFNLWAYKEENKVMTTLVEGSVKIKDFDGSGNGVIIKPNEQLILNKTEKGILIRKVDPLDYTAWKDGRFIFVKQSLDDILKILSRWYNFDVEFESDELKTIVFTGNMDRYEDLSTPLEMISKTNKVNFKTEGRKVIVTNRK